MLNSNIIEDRRTVKILFIFSILSASLLFASGFYYKDLGCDGAWYSYPALALSRGGSPVENFENVDDIRPVQGVKALFGFNQK